MNDTIHAAMCDVTLAERLGNRTVNWYEVSGVNTLADIQRVQAFCDAQNRTARWQFNRNGNVAVLHVTEGVG